MPDNFITSGAPRSPRLRRLYHSVASGYAVLFANIVFSLAQVPLALHYLNKAEFGLWALAFQIAGYLQLIDFGMSGSVSRLLIDHKHQPDGGAYGSTVQTGFLVLVVQGVIILFGGITFTLAFSRWLNLPADLLKTFQWLMVGLCLMLAFTFSTRIFSHLLTAHQRFDVVNYSQVGLFGVNFLVQWLCFRVGFGVSSILYGNAAGWLLTAVVNGAACLRFKVFPTSGNWSKPTRQRFHEIFAFGKDVFWVAVGSQLIVGSQTILVSRNLGLDAAATWSVCTRTYLLVTQLVWRVFDYSGPALAEMMVLKEESRLQSRLKSLTLITTSLAVVGGVIFAICNQPFVASWTSRRIGWSQQNDTFLGAWLVLSAIVHCLGGFVLITKRVGFMKYIYFIEGLVFIIVGSFALKWGGFGAFILTSLLCTTLFSLPYCIWRTHDYFHIPVREITLQWLGPPTRLAFLFAALALGTWYLGKGFDPKVQLIAEGSVLACLGILLFFRYGMEKELLRELHARAPGRLRPLLALVTAGN